MKCFNRNAGLRAPQFLHFPAQKLISVLQSLHVLLLITVLQNK